MATSRKYFHDHLVLLLLSINGFLALTSTILVLLRLSSGHGSAFIVACRDCSNPGAINKFSTGSVVDLLGFIAFALLVVGIHTMLSLRSYRINRQLSLTILSLGVLLLVLNIIVSNALLVLR